MLVKSFFFLDDEEASVVSFFFLLLSPAKLSLLMNEKQPFLHPFAFAL